jgi:parallel beta-helix repeat protein
LLDCGAAYILRNTIEGNHDGIVMITSIPTVMNNIVRSNKENGVFLLKDSRPTLYGNEIINNGKIGLYVRDKSNGDIRGNIFENKYIDPNFKDRDDPVDIAVERKHQYLEHIVSDNEVKGEARIPQNLRGCTIF